MVNQSMESSCWAQGRRPRASDGFLAHAVAHIEIICSLLQPRWYRNNGLCNGFLKFDDQFHSLMHPCKTKRHLMIHAKYNYSFYDK